MTRRHRALRIAGWVALAAALIVVLLNWTWGRLPAEPDPTGKFMQVGDVRIRYVERPGTGTPVVLIHGLPGTAEDFEDVLPRLRGRRAIAIDRPGFGFSSGGFHGFGDQIESVDGLLEALRIPQAVVVGHSYGGTVALGLAERHPERVAGLVLVDAGAGGVRMAATSRAEARSIQALGLPVVQQLAHVTFAQAMLTATGKMGDAEAFDPDPVDPDHEARLLAVNMQDEDLDALAGERLEANDVFAEIDRRLPSVGTRAVVIQGAGDQLVAPEHARTLAAALPNARLTMVPGGHMVTYAHPEVVAAAVRQFP
ncbi:MAG: alpha/beta hydrolase [Solirubrobacteraceae bacterium]|nr:alpha/beta hydrolase [Solirubrobacteraceae bacterium]